MTTATAKRISKYARNDEVQTWKAGLMKFLSAVRFPIVSAASCVCADCPYRYNISVGGCIGDECPIYAVKKAVELAPRRMTAATKEITKARCARVA